MVAQTLSVDRMQRTELRNGPVSAGKRRIAVFTGKRGGFGAMLRIMRLIADDPAMELRVIASDMHLDPRFGQTISEVRSQVAVDAVVDLSNYGDTPLDRAQALGRCVERLAAVLSEIRPDILLLLGDRGETLAAAMCAAELGIVIAHIQAGDISGGLDDIHRHAITKLSHLHFSQNESQRQRVIRLGEAADRVWNSGAPYVDNIVRGTFPASAEALATLGLSPDLAYFIILQHPDTYRAEQSYKDTAAILSVMAGRSEHKIVIYPCSDPGYGGVIEAIGEIEHCPRFHVYKNIESDTFLGLLRGAKALVGNSSAGIIEAPYFSLPFINVGARQDGRETAKNVINCDGTAASIEAGLAKICDERFRELLQATNRPFGDGFASERIFEVLKAMPINAALFRKRITY
jgi:UDP-N-acetylglucosamine 2-epimerase (non-hydrolysing)/GDP/UDP-N,N'-diacetylbacillosamine 2-epimerase (hydrolysing)